MALGRSRGVTRRRRARVVQRRRGGRSRIRDGFGRRASFRFGRFFSSDAREVTRGGRGRDASARRSSRASRGRGGGTRGSRRFASPADRYRPGTVGRARGERRRRSIFGVPLGRRRQRRADGGDALHLQLFRFPGVGVAAVRSRPRGARAGEPQLLVPEGAPRNPRVSPRARRRARGRRGFIFASTGAATARAIELRTASRRWTRDDARSSSTSRGDNSTWTCGTPRRSFSTARAPSTFAGYFAEGANRRRFSSRRTSSITATSTPTTRAPRARNAPRSTIPAGRARESRQGRAPRAPDQRRARTRGALSASAGRTPRAAGAIGRIVETRARGARERIDARRRAQERRAFERRRRRAWGTTPNLRRTAVTSWRVPGRRTSRSRAPSLCCRVDARTSRAIAARFANRRLENWRDKRVCARFAEENRRRGRTRRRTRDARSRPPGTTNARFARRCSRTSTARGVARNANTSSGNFARRRRRASSFDRGSARRVSSSTRSDPPSIAIASSRCAATTPTSRWWRRRRSGAR